MKKRFALSLALVAGLVMGATTANAASIKATGAWQIDAAFTENNDFNGESKDNSFSIGQRMRTAFQFIANENLKGVLETQIGTNSWGNGLYQNSAGRTPNANSRAPCPPATEHHSCARATSTSTARHQGEVPGGLPEPDLPAASAAAAPSWTTTSPARRPWCPSPTASAWSAASPVPWTPTTSAPPPTSTTPALLTPRFLYANLDFTGFKVRLLRVRLRWRNTVSTGVAANQGSGMKTWTPPLASALAPTGAAPPSP
jgi:hypothetical protein